MLVKVRNKATREVQHITPRAYELAKKKYDRIGNEANEKANVFDPKGSESTSQTISTAQTVTLPKAGTQTGSQHIQEAIKDGASAIAGTEPQTEDSPNPQPTAEKEKVAEAVAENNGQPKKRGRPAKTQNQISSPAATSEV